MQAPFRIEIFDEKLNNIAESPIVAPRIKMDYLTLEGISIEAPKVMPTEGRYARIIGRTGKPEYCGVIEDIQDAGNKTIYSLVPLLSLLDVSVHYDRTILQEKPVEDFIETVIYETYANNDDTLQNLPKVQVQKHSSTMVKLNIKSNIHDFWEICTRCLTLYNVVIVADMNPQTKTVVFNVARIEGMKIIESDLKNCISKSITIGKNRYAINKALYINKNDETEKVTYYLHNNGSIGTDDTDRITPVIFHAQYIEMDDFLEEAEERATALLTPAKYNNFIEIQCSASDKLIMPQEMQIGQPTIITSAGQTYETIFSGWYQENECYILYFGVMRLDLTDILGLERRNANAY